MNRTFLGIDQPDYNKAKVVIVPFGYEKTTSYHKGTAKGPQAIIDASMQLELYDIETDSRPAEVGIHTLLEPEEMEIDTEEMTGRISGIVGKILEDGKFPVILGGEHSISIGIVRAFSAVFDELSVLQIDAHADLRDEYENSKYNHACVMRRISEMAPYVGVGIRSAGPEEAGQLKRMRQSGRIFTMDETENSGWCESVVDKLSRDVYITIDADAFDPSVIPGVGTPEPDGFSFKQVDGLLGVVRDRRNIVGMDFVELRPLEGETRSEFTAAKLIYKTIARKFRKQ
jgi:agmatinase